MWTKTCTVVTCAVLSCLPLVQTFYIIHRLYECWGLGNAKIFKMADVSNQYNNFLEQAGKPISELRDMKLLPDWAKNCLPCGGTCLSYVTGNVVFIVCLNVDGEIVGVMCRKYD